MVIDPTTLSPREAYALFISAIVPRPIAFVTSMNEHKMVNAAPFSFFNAIASSPLLLMISIARKKGARKHTTENILHTKNFVVNVVTEDLVQAMNISAGDFPPDISEIEAAHLSLTPSIRITTPSIAEAAVRCECILHKHIEVGNEPSDLIIGEVVQFHVKEGFLSNGVIDQTKLRPVGRMGGNFYSKTNDVFELPRYNVEGKR